MARIAIDGTAAAVQSAGVGRYTRELLRALLQMPGDDRYQILTASDQAATEELARELPPGAWREFRRMPASERVMTALWQRLRIPISVETIAGDFDVIHGPDFVIPPTKRPSVVTIHDLSYIRVPELGEPTLVEYLRSAVPRSLRRANQVITVSASVAAELVEAYPFVQHKVRAIPNGVTIPQRPSNLGDDNCAHPQVLIVGTIEPRKNHLALLSAMPLVWQRYPDAELVIAGRVGWRSDQIVAALTDAAANSRVRLVHQPSDAELDALFEQATVFVYPSLYEGFGLPVLEAMSRGVPTIASDITSLRETGGDAARYVATLDFEELGNEIIELIDDTALRNNMIESGHARVSRYTWSETARRTRLAYQAAIEENPT